MSKHKMFSTDLPPKPNSLPVHPIWRGIGCLIAVVIPILFFMVASILIENRSQLTWLIIPQDLVISSAKDGFILVKIFYAAIGTLVISGLIALITFLINWLFGPKKYGPKDIPLDQIDKF